jgi:RHS repeat-associated protein
VRTRTESLHKSTRNTLGVCSINSRELSPEPYNQMQLSSDVQIPDGLLAANALLSEKPRLGFRSDDSTLRWGSSVVISSTAIGISGTLYDSRIESRYTGKERDTESGNDYFGARYYGSSMGRFSSPDPGWTDAVDLANPQSWNLYSYVLNNPLINIDPDGLDCVYINNDTGKYEGFNTGDCNNSDPNKANTGNYIDGTVNGGAAGLSINNQGVVTGYSATSDNGSTLFGSFTTPPGAPSSNSPGQIPQLSMLPNVLDPPSISSPNPTGITIGPTPKPPTLPPPSLYECLVNPDDAMAIHRAAQQMNAGQRINPGAGDESAMGKAGQQIRFYGGNAKQQLRMIGDANADSQFSGGALIASQAAASGQCLLTK